MAEAFHYSTEMLSLPEFFNFHVHFELSEWVTLPFIIINIVINLACIDFYNISAINNWEFHFSFITNPFKKIHDNTGQKKQETYNTQDYKLSSSSLSSSKMSVFPDDISRLGSILEFNFLTENFALWSLIIFQSSVDSLLCFPGNKSWTWSLKFI